MKKRIICLVSVFVLIFADCINAQGPVSVDYNYSETVTPGTIRYVSQIRSSDVYYQDYWGRFSPWAHNECGTASVSMALSAIGIAKTPLELGNYWISKGYTWGNPFSTVLNDVPGATGGETCDFFGSFNRYIEGNGSYSPVIIYFTAATNPNRTGNRHFVVVTEKNKDGSFNAVNPASKTMLNLKIEKTSGGSLYVTVYGHKGTTAGYISEYDFRSAQYHNPAFVPPAPAEVVTEAPSSEAPSEEAPEAEAPAAAITYETPDLLFPASIDPASPTIVSHDFCEVRFMDTGCDTYNLYFRRAATPGAGALFNDEHRKSLTLTVGEGLIARNGDGTLSIFIPEGLEKGYLYRFYITSADGKICRLTTYGIAE